MENAGMIELVADIVSAHVSNNTVAVNDLPRLIQNIHDALRSLSDPIPITKVPRQPAVPVRRSVKRDYVICLLCGSKQKMLKRHLLTAHELTPDIYRKEFGLPKSYPLVAPNYAETRRALAHAIGLGRAHRRQSDLETTGPETISD